MHNYQKLIAKMHAQNKGILGPGVFAELTVEHDSWCGTNEDKECNCHPDITASIDKKTYRLKSNGKLKRIITN